MTSPSLAKWIPFPRYKDIRLAAELACGHVVWAMCSGWPQHWTGSLHCPMCDQPGKIGQWWFVQ